LKIAYLMVAYKRPTQLPRLVNALNNSNTSFFIHVDKKVNILPYYKELKTLKDQNSHFINNRVKVYWGGYSLVQAIINGLKEICNSKIYFDYVILLSESDYPIKTNEYISNFFIQNLGKQFLEYGPVPRKNWIDGGIKRLSRYHFMDIRNRYLKYILKILSKYIPRNHVLKGTKIYGGNLWWCITYNCAEFILDFIDNNPKYCKYFKYTMLPDEVFFHTIIVNSIFHKDIINKCLHYIDWTIPDHTGHYPRIIIKNDFDTLSSVDKLFARKFDIYFDSEILDLIDEKILKSVNPS